MKILDCFKMSIKSFISVKNEKISNAIIYLHNKSELKYFAVFLYNVHIIRNDNVRTAGVIITNRGPIMVYNDDFFNSLTEKQCAFVLIHEVFHLIHNHNRRLKNCDNDIANIATDGIINDIIIKDENINFNVNVLDNVILMDKDYCGEHISEPYYEWLYNKTDFNVDENNYIKYKKLNFTDERGKNVDINKYFFDTHKISISDIKDELYKNNIEDAEEVDDEIKDVIIENIINDIKNRGYESDNITKHINLLRKTNRNYMKEIISYITNMSQGINKELTYSRLNRKGIFGLKGYRKSNNNINCILDVSGSMDGYFEIALSTLFKRNITINLIQCDIHVTNFSVIKNDKELQNIEIKGLGGTTLQPGIDFITNNKELNKYPTIIITDGFCDNLNTEKLKYKTLLLTTNITPNINGKCKVIKIE